MGTKDLWRGYTRWRFGKWICKHCSSIVDDPELHTTWHKDIRDCIMMLT